MTHRDQLNGVQISMDGTAATLSDETGLGISYINRLKRNRGICQKYTAAEREAATTEAQNRYVTAWTITWQLPFVDFSTCVVGNDVTCSVEDVTAQINSFLAEIDALESLAREQINVKCMRDNRPKILKRKLRRLANLKQQAYDNAGIYPNPVLYCQDPHTD